MGETSLNMRWNMLQVRACGNVRDNRIPWPDFEFLQKEALFNRLLGPRVWVFEWHSCFRLVLPFSSIILPNVFVGAVEKLLFPVELVFQHGAPQGLLDLALAPGSLLPAVEPHRLEDGVTLR